MTIQAELFSTTSYIQGYGGTLVVTFPGQSPKSIPAKTWQGGRLLLIVVSYPAAAWLVTHGFEYDTNLNQDPDGDGVDLRMAYALNLDPRLNLQDRLPAPVLDADTLSLNFHASSPGITYRVETSTDLADWTTTGITQSAPGADGRTTASVPRDAPQRFLRLVVQD